MDTHLTLQVIEQLGLDPAECRGHTVRELAEKHELMWRLAGSPWSFSEATSAALWEDTFYLHRGPWCVLSRYDREHGILWLCHVGSHPGEHSVDHDLAGDSGSIDQWLPTDEDFLDLPPDLTAFVLRLFEVGSRPIKQAHANPGHEVVYDLGLLRVRILVENVTEDYEVRQQTWLAFSHVQENASLAAIQQIFYLISVALGVLLHDVDWHQLPHEHNDPETPDAIATFLWQPWRRPQEERPEQ